MKVARASGLRDASRAIAVSTSSLVSILIPTSETGPMVADQCVAQDALPQQYLLSRDGNLNENGDSAARNTRMKVSGVAHEAPRLPPRNTPPAFDRQLRGRKDRSTRRREVPWREHTDSSDFNRVRRAASADPNWTKAALVEG
jgi:hypothetical protein